MIKFIENSETNLKFVSYPIGSFISYLLLLLIFIPLLCWGLYFSPIYSSLTCQRVFFNRIDCQLQEKSILDSNLTELSINNVKKTGKHFFGSRDARMILKANPHPPYLHINRFQRTYFYPSSPFSLVLFRNFNPLNWFSNPNQEKQLNNFIQGKLSQPVLLLEQKIKGADYILIGFFFFIPLLFIYSVIAWLLSDAIFYRYEIDLVEKTLTISGQRIFFKNIERQYQLDRIKQIKLDTGYKTNFNSGRIILEFEPDYDYPLEEFFNTEEGETNFQIIKSFTERSR